MNKLKSVLADKIIEISEVGGDNVKSKLEKVNRFRDFAGACQALMTKYPVIEDELINMVNDDDFDTKIASSRVDSIIRLKEGLSENTHAASDKNTQEVIDKLEELADQFEIEDQVPQEKLLPEEVDYEIISENTEPQNNYSEFVNEEEQRKSVFTKENMKRVIQVCGIILIIIVIIFIIKFVKENWQAVLLSLIHI